MKELELTYKPGFEPSIDLMKVHSASRLGVDVKQISDIVILKKSIDARGGKVLFRYSVRVALNGEKLLPRYSLPEYKQTNETSESVIIIGAGPAGLFAALSLLSNGIKPIILERGKDVHARKVDIAKLCRYQLVNPNSNYCFGEGGAGTFSDGKLYTRSTKRGDVNEVLSQLVHFGADKSILIESHPHIGSDKLPAIIENIRKCIIDFGGEVHFNTLVTDMEYYDNVWNVKCNTLANNCSEIKLFSSKNIILAAGNSAKDIYKMFYEKGWSLEAKGFALGVRVEHPQELINRLRYHSKFFDKLPAAEYSSVCQVEGRGVFSFCMCPGGLLVPSVTAEDEIVLNGMSNSMRNSPKANSGVVVQIEPNDVKGFDEFGPLKLLKFQESVEKAMFEYSKGSLKAPAQRMTDFINGRISKTLPKSTYPIGIISAPLHTLLPKFISKRLQLAFKEFDKKMRGYVTPESILLGVESRTSSPVRIVRDSNTLQCINLPGIYPCGEGAGYAGGIISSAIDGINAAKLVAATSTR
jgi:Uncharacterized FAD-dependent dehydrogenases